MGYCLSFRRHLLLLSRGPLSQNFPSYITWFLHVPKGLNFNFLNASKVFFKPRSNNRFLSYQLVLLAPNSHQYNPHTSHSQVGAFLSFLSPSLRPLPSLEHLSHPIFFHLLSQIPRIEFVVGFFFFCFLLLSLFAVFGVGVSKRVGALGDQD